MEERRTSVRKAIDNKKGRWMMALVHWNNDLSVQVAEMDRQHQKLIGMINDLHEAMSKGKGKEIIGKIIEGLLSYTKVHFSEEEKLMEKYQYPEVDAQKKMHKYFIDKPAQFKRDLENGKLGLTIDVSDFLSDWLKSHIQKEDKKYGPHLNKSGLR
jgi:hemerythrin